MYSGPPAAMNVSVATSFSDDLFSSCAGVVLSGFKSVGEIYGDALAASRLFGADGALPFGLSVGVWGRRQPLDTALRDGDRVAPPLAKKAATLEKFKRWDAQYLA